MRGERKIGMMEDWNDGRVEYRTVCRFSTPILQHPHTPTPRSSARKAGFSLLEVLVALAIFGIAAGGMLVALGNHLKNVSFLQDHERAVRIASREMNSMRRLPEFEETETNGMEGHFSWTSQITADGMDDWPGLDSATGTPARLSVTVQWSDSEDGPALGKVHLDGFDVF